MGDGEEAAHVAGSFLGPTRVWFPVAKPLLWRPERCSDKFNLAGSGAS